MNWVQWTDWNGTNGKHSTGCIIYKVKCCPITMINDGQTSSNDYSLQLKSFVYISVTALQTTSLIFWVFCLFERSVFWHSIHLEFKCILPKLFFSSFQRHSTTIQTHSPLLLLPVFLFRSSTKCTTIKFPLTFWTIFFLYFCQFKFVFRCKIPKKKKEIKPIKSRIAG